MRRFWSIVVTTVVTGLLGIAPAAAASFGPGGQVAGSPKPPKIAAGPRQLRGGPDANASASPSWAGWGDIGRKHVQLGSVAATFRVPRVTCGAYGQEATFWVGLDGWINTGHTVEQVGIEALCTVRTSSGVVARYRSVWEMFPSGLHSQGAVAPGDRISLSAAYHPKTGKYHLTLTDASARKARIDANASCPKGSVCRNSSAEVIAGDPGGGPQFGVFLANFGTVRFSAIAVTSRGGRRGALEGNSAWSTAESIMEFPGTTIMAMPSARSNGGKAFSVTYQSAG